MFITGFADEAAAGIDRQIAVCRELGWKHIDLRAIDGINVTAIDERAFEALCEKLAAAGLQVASFGSTIANWSKKIEDAPDSSYEEMKRAAPRMRRLGVKYIRIMSFAVPNDERVIHDKQLEREVIRRVKEIVRIAADGGVVCVHENCNNWAGRSFEHTLRLLDAVDSPALKLVFDTGNPIANLDFRGKPPFKRQDAWEFYSKVREQVVYVHIKDLRIEGGNEVYTFPGEGEAQVPRILADLKRRGYDGGCSIEPHMAVVFHDASKTAGDEERWDNFVEYGRRSEKLLREAGYKI